MGKGVRVGIIVEAIVLVAAVALSIFYFRFGLFRTDHGVDIWLIIVWVLVAAVLLLVLWWRSQTREEMVRRFYLSDKGIYNHEIGYAPFSRVAASGDAYEFVSFAADSLTTMSYGFDVADRPEDFKPTLVISTRAFRFHQSGEGDEAGAVIDQWKGSLLSVGIPGDEKTYTEIGSYENIKELAHLLEENDVFAGDALEDDLLI